MRSAIILAFVFAGLTTVAQQKDNPTLKSILLEQLKTTHNTKDWFVPINNALEGLTPEQAKWKDGSGNHSIAQLASHLLFWNMEQLAKFKGEKPPKFSGNNDDTFNSLTNDDWKQTVSRLDSVLTQWEKVVEAADEAKLKTWYSAIAHIGAHNAYHTGQMIYIRKQQGIWDAAKGVK